MDFEMNVSEKMKKCEMIFIINFFPRFYST